MASPFVFIGTHRLKQGRLDGYREYWQEFSRSIEANEPRLLAFELYVDEDRNEVSILQVHPDADSMLTHMRVAQQQIKSAYGEQGSIDATTSIQVFGTPTREVLEMIEQLAGSGVPVTIRTPAGGFSRFLTVTSGTPSSDAGKGS